MFHQVQHFKNIGMIEPLGVHDHGIMQYITQQLQERNSLCKLWSLQYGIRVTDTKKHTIHTTPARTWEHLRASCRMREWASGISGFSRQASKAYSHRPWTQSSKSWPTIKWFELYTPVRKTTHQLRGKIPLFKPVHKVLQHTRNSCLHNKIT